MKAKAHPYASRPVAATHVWLTPPAIKDPLGKFDLDPCAAPLPRPWPTARTHYALPQDGLALPWFGRVWLNPPYGAHTGRWLARLAEHGRGTALVFARTDTRMFRDHVWPHVTALLFLEGRPKFCRPDGTPATGNSGGPLVLLAYGETDAATLKSSGLPGKFLVP